MAGKRTKATEEEAFFIGVNPKKMNQQDLANKFDLSLKVVSKIQEEYNVTEAKKAELIKANSPAEPTQFRKMMGTKSESGKKGVSIMTEGASEVMDAQNAKARQNARKNKYANDFTTKSYPDE